MEITILKIINTVLENRGKKQLTTIESNYNLRNDIGFDSLDLAELTVRIEAEYGVDVFEEGIVVTIDDILKKLVNK